VIVLDENVLDGQRLLLEASRVAIKQIGVAIGHKGMKDDEIIVLLRKQRNLSFSRAMRVSMVPDCGIGVIA
jgi:hypothetical protein